MTMFILGRDWSGGYLDYHRADGELRLSVRAWLKVCPASGVFFVRPRSLRFVWNYLREFGIGIVLRKIISRMQESLRNEKVLAVGLGRVCQSDPGSQWKEGTAVAFAAPCHPGCVERIVLPPAFVQRVDASLLERLDSPDGVRWFEGAPEGLAEQEVIGWSPYSGLPVPREALERMFAGGLRFWREADPGQGTVLPLPAPTPVAERSPHAAQDGPAFTAVLFGLGNHAKTRLLRDIDRRIRVTCVHEIDPTQVGQVARCPWAVDTSPGPRPDERADAYFIAGYHHTHAALAVHALQAGAYAVVEKPPVTTRAQLERLTEAVRCQPGRLFVCYQKRYNPLWQLARKDLGTRQGDPIHYSCIVYEVPLPPHHWYRWPTSQSALVSNGCHWLDHFLFLNGYCPVERAVVWRAGNGDLAVNVDLANAAHFSMNLTKVGSERIGMQEHIQLRAGKLTVRVDNSSRYLAEGPDRILRRTKIRRQVEDRIMYQTIARMVTEGCPGDSPQSLEVGGRLLIDLEEQLQSLGGAANE